MKKALKINLSGQIFHIDEDAYEKLKLYLDSISRHFSNASESKEILSDIESRIAELFREKMGDINQVITILEVNRIIDIMGRPEEIASDDSEEQYTSGRKIRETRRLYRDPDNSVFGGVSSGLAAYFNIDVLLVRILFIILTILGGGLPVIIYLILWIAVPRALTAAQKLEMRGEKVTVSNIEKTIREEYEGVKENLKKARESETFKRTEDFFTKILHVCGVIIKAFLKLFLILIAIIFIFAGIAILLSSLSVLFLGVNIPVDIGHNLELSFPELIQPFFNPTNATLFIFAASLLVLIPVVAVIYVLFKLLFRFKGRDRMLGTVAFVFWLLALVTTFGLVYYEGRNFREGDTVSHMLTIEDLKTDTLYLSMNENLPEEMQDDQSIDFSDHYLFSRDMKTISGQVEVDIKRSSDEDYKIQVRKTSRGLDPENARDLANQILYNYSRQAEKLKLDSYFRLDDNSPWRIQKVSVILYIPQDKAVHLDESTSEYLHDVDNIEDIYDEEMAGHTWIMKEEGLSWTIKK